MPAIHRLHAHIQRDLDVDLVSRLPFLIAGHPAPVRIHLSEDRPAAVTCIPPAHAGTRRLNRNFWAAGMFRVIVTLSSSGYAVSCLSLTLPQVTSEGTY